MGMGKNNIYGDGITQIKDWEETENEGGDEKTSNDPVTPYVTENSGNAIGEKEYRDQNGYSANREEYGVKVGELDEQSFYAMNGLDPDRDYESQKKELEYSYMTQMATYGANAEKLFQMGLSNSGVSDIFGADAYSAYLSNLNAAASQRIEQKRKNKQAFNNYKQGIDAGWLDEDSKAKQGYNSYLNVHSTDISSQSATAYNAVLESNMFTGNLKSGETFDGDVTNYAEYDKISNYLKNAEYSDAVIAEVWNKLSRIDPEDLKKSAIYNGLSLIDMETYKGTEAQKKWYSDRLRLQNYSDENIAEILEMADSNLNYIKDSVDIASIADALYAECVDANGAYIYDGSDYYKAMIKRRYGESTYTEEQWNDIFARMDSLVVEDAEVNDKAVSDTVDGLGDKVTVENLLGAIESSSSEESKNEYRTRIADMLTSAVGQPAGAHYDTFKYYLSSAGVSESDWATYDSGQKEMALMDSTALACGNGDIDSASFNRMVYSWISSEADLLEGEKNKKVKQIADNMLESLKKWQESAKISYDEYNRMVASLMTHENVVESYTEKLKTPAQSTATYSGTISQMQLEVGGCVEIGSGKELAVIGGQLYKVTSAREMVTAGKTYYYTGEIIYNYYAIEKERFDNRNGEGSYDLWVMLLEEKGKQDLKQSVTDEYEANLEKYRNRDNAQ